MWKPTLRILKAPRRPRRKTPATSCIPSSSSGSSYRLPLSHRRCFHEYFITHLPSTSLHPDSRPPAGPHHKLPRDKSTPHEPRGTNRSPAAAPPMAGASREMTVVRIPIKSAKHHFGVSLSRGVRPYNEDAFQAGTIEIPAFAKRRPMSLTRNSSGAYQTEVRPADSASGDPQVFYFGVFDGHGGMECSEFLREQLHTYIEEATKDFELESSLKGKAQKERSPSPPNGAGEQEETPSASESYVAGRETLHAIKMHTPPGTKPLKPPGPGHSLKSPPEEPSEPPSSAPPLAQSSNTPQAETLQRSLVQSWSELVGGYFRRFKPEHFSLSAGGRSSPPPSLPISIETVLTYAFLKADYDFVSAQVLKRTSPLDTDPVLADRAINDADILGSPSLPPSHPNHPIGGTKRFRGGSTCSVALISTPTPSPFWHPASPSTLIIAHVGDTRILLCETSTGLAVPLTQNHHPSLPEEANRLRRYATSFTTDSFGEERVSGLANTRAFGDMASKRIGVSAEPEIRRIELAPAEYSFLVLVSDGVSGHLGDQEIVDIVKEAKTPEQAARDVTGFAVEVSKDADNATTLVVRLGGWERRNEGGLGSMGTREMRDWRREEAEESQRATR